MLAVGSFETLLPIYRTARHKIQKRVIFIFTAVITSSFVMSVMF
jgi:hypothetical protein